MREVIIHSLPSGTNDARRLALRLGLPLQEITVHRFPDGEIRVAVGRAGATTIIYGSLDQPNDKLIAILFAVEALRRAGAGRIVLLAPYLCYMRQDVAFAEGEAMSQKAVGRLIAANVDRIITVDAHLHRTPDIRSVFPGIEAENLSATPAIASALVSRGINPATIVVGPDAESSRSASDLAARLGLAHMVAEKLRHGDRLVEIRFPDPASLAGQPVLLVDDIASSGATLIACAEALVAAGAGPISAIVTHALFPNALMGRFREAGILSIRSTTSVRHPTNAISLDETLTAALQREVNSQAMPETKNAR
jgi:ribose-phosphate pyrophosphokinase